MECALHHKYPANLGKRSPTMRNGILLVRREFGERLAISVWNKQRIISKAFRARRGGSDSAEALPNGGMLHAVGINKRNRTCEVGGAVLDTFEIPQQKRIIARRAGWFACVARTAHTGSPAQRLYFQTGVVGHAPRTGVLSRDCTNLYECVANEVRGRLLYSLRIVSNDIELREYLRYLPNLVLPCYR